MQGVYPIYNCKFRIGIKGLSSGDGDMKEVAELENLGIKIDGTVETWTSMSSQGWSNSLMTGKSFSVEGKGKRSVGDPGNDYIHGIAYKDGLDCNTVGDITFPDGSKLTFNAVANVTNPGGDDATKVAPLEFTLQGQGKPVYTPAQAPKTYANGEGKVK